MKPKRHNLLSVRGGLPARTLGMSQNARLQSSDGTDDDAAMSSWALAELQREMHQRDERIEQLQGVLLRKAEEHEELDASHAELREQLEELRGALAEKLGLVVPPPAGVPSTDDTAHKDEAGQAAGDKATDPSTAGASQTASSGLNGLREMDALGQWAADRVVELQLGLVGVGGVAQERLAAVAEKANALRAEAVARLPVSSLDEILASKAAKPKEQAGEPGQG